MEQYVAGAVFVLIALFVVNKMTGGVVWTWIKSIFGRY